MVAPRVRPAIPYTRPPPAHVPPDWSRPINQGLQFATSVNYEIVHTAGRNTMKPTFVAASPTFASSAFGKSILCSTTTTSGKYQLLGPIAPDPPLTIMFTYNLSTNATTNFAFSSGNYGSAGWSLSIGASTATKALTLYFGTTTFIFPWAAGTGAINADYVFVLILKADLASATIYRLNRSRIIETATTSALTGYVNSTKPILVGGAYLSGTPDRNSAMQGVLGPWALWNRELSDQEARSILLNPYQIWSIPPRKITLRNVIQILLLADATVSTAIIAKLPTKILAVASNSIEAMNRKIISLKKATAVASNEFLRKLTYKTYKTTPSVSLSKMGHFIGKKLLVVSTGARVVAYLKVKPVLVAALSTNTSSIKRLIKATRFTSEIVALVIKKGFTATRKVANTSATGIKKIFNLKKQSAAVVSNKFVKKNIANIKIATSTSSGGLRRVRGATIRAFSTTFTFLKRSLALVRKVASVSSSIGKFSRFVKRTIAATPVVAVRGITRKLLVAKMAIDATTAIIKRTFIRKLQSTTSEIAKVATFSFKSIKLTISSASVVRKAIKLNTIKKATSTSTTQFIRAIRRIIRTSMASVARANRAITTKRIAYQGEAAIVAKMVKTVKRATSISAAIATKRFAIIRTVTSVSLRNIIKRISTIKFIASASTGRIKRATVAIKTAASLSKANIIRTIKTLRAATGISAPKVLRKSFRKLTTTTSISIVNIMRRNQKIVPSISTSASLLKRAIRKIMRTPTISWLLVNLFPFLNNRPTKANTITLQQKIRTIVLSNREKQKP